MRPGSGVAPDRSAGVGIERRAQQRHAAIHVECGLHARQRQPELHQRDGDGRLHADDDGAGAEDPRHARDVRDHAADEAVDDLEARDVDEHAARARRRYPLGQIVLQRERQPVVHVDLDRDEQEIAHPEDRDALHGSAMLRSRG
jgi:hypothetical protein